MPLAARLIFALGLSREPRAIGLLDRAVRILRPRPPDFGHEGNGYYYYVQTICLVAERLGLPCAVPILLALHRKPGLHGLKSRERQDGIMDERMGYLEVAIGRALARCGSPAGARLLIGFLDDSRRRLAEHARAELAAISGRDLGLAAAAWRRWLKKSGRRLRPRPWLHRGE
jgi:hypothetical protein